MKEEIELLNNIYQNAKIALQSISDIYDKTKNSKLKKELKFESEGYEKISKMCENFANNNKIELKDNNFFKKAKLWTSINLSTLNDDSTRHIAEMMLIGTVMGTLTCYKNQNDYKNVNEELIKYSNNLLEIEEDYFNRLKEYLKN